MRQIYSLVFMGVQVSVVVARSSNSPWTMFAELKLEMPPRYNKLFGDRPFGGATIDASGGWNDVFFFEVERVGGWALSSRV